MQWLIDIIKEWIEGVPYATQQWVEDQNYLTHAYVCRGDHSAYDFTLPDFVIAAVFHDRLLSPPAPENTSAVAFSLEFRNSIVGAWIRFRTKGYTGTHNLAVCQSQVANIARTKTIIIPTDEDGQIQYAMFPAGWIALNLIVKGWFL